MDETEQTKGLPSDKTEKAPEGSEGTTPTAETKTQYTQEEIEAIKAQAAQDARIKAGREVKKLTDWEASLKAQQSEIEATRVEISRIQEQIDQAELEAARGDPAKLKELQAKKSYKNMLADLENQKKELKKREQEQTRKEAEHAEKVKAAEEVTLGMKLYEIAARYKLNPEDLKKDMKDLSLTTEAQAEALAKRLKPAGERPPEGETEKKTTTPVSVPTTGGVRGTPTQEQREKMPMEDYAALRKKEDPNLI